jgi:hypothetical protein
MSYATESELATARARGYAIDCSQQIGHSFMNSARYVWSIRDGWQTADLITGQDFDRFSNHQKYSDLESALNRPLSE